MLRFLSVLGLFLIWSLAASAQKGGLSVSTAEAHLAASQQKASELKNAAEAARVTASGTRTQFETQQRALQDLQKRLAKEDGAFRVAAAKQKSAEMQMKRDEMQLREARKREKAMAKL